LIEHLRPRQADISAATSATARERIRQNASAGAKNVKHPKRKLSFFGKASESVIKQTLPSGLLQITDTLQCGCVCKLRAAQRGTKTCQLLSRALAHARRRQPSTLIRKSRL
jgi:hypothetical protein